MNNTGYSDPEEGTKRMPRLSDMDLDELVRRGWVAPDGIRFDADGNPEYDYTDKAWEEMCDEDRAIFEAGVMAIIEARERVYEDFDEEQKQIRARRRERAARG